VSYVAVKSLLLDDSTVFFFDVAPAEILEAVVNAYPEEIKIILTEYGFDLRVKSISLPIEDKMIEHIAKTKVLVIVSAEPQSYLMIPTYRITVPPELVYEARGALNFSRMAG
jgi:hypothetical protein